MSLFWEEHGRKREIREGVKGGKEVQRKRNGKMKRRGRLEEKGDSTGGRKNCWEWVGQLIFYKPGLERSWNEEWEKDSWEPATGKEREKEWDSWITVLWSETSVGFEAEGEKQRVVGEKWLHPASSVCLDRFQLHVLSMSAFFTLGTFLKSIGTL